MKRLFLLLPFLITSSFAQVYAPDPDFCFLPINKIYRSDLDPNDDYISKQYDGGYVFTSRFNILNGQKVEDQPTDSNVKLYFKFDRYGNHVPAYRFLSEDKYVYGGQALKNGKMLWCESDFYLSRVKLIRLNENGSIDSTFKYHGFEPYIYKKYVLSSGKTIVSVDRSNFKVINEDGSLATKDIFNLPSGMFPVSNCFYNNNDYILAANLNKTCKIYKINSDFTLKEIYSVNLNSTSWISDSKIYVDLKGRIYLNLLEADSYTSKIIRLREDGKEDASFKTGIIIKSPAIDPNTAKLTFTDSGKIVYSRKSIIMCFNEDGTTDTTFAIPLIENNRIIYDVTENGEVLMLYNREFMKVDFNGNKVPFQLKLEISKPISFNNILPADNEKFYAINDNYVGRLNLKGKIESELFSPDTAVFVKKYFDNQLVIKRGNTNFTLSEGGLKQISIPDVVWNSILDYTGRKAYRIEGDKIVRYNEDGKEEYRFAHNIPGIKQIFVLANRKLLVIGKLTDTVYEGMFYMFRLNIDGSADKDFKTVELNMDGFFGPDYEIKELPNGSICVKNVIISETTGTKIRLFDANGTELGKNVTKDLGNPRFAPKIFYPKIGRNNTLLFLDYFSRLKRWTSEAVLDSSFSIKGINYITAFETIDSTSLLITRNEKIFKVSTLKQKFITLIVPEQIDVEGAPVVIKAIASDGSQVVFSSTGNGILRDSVLSWTKSGNGTIEAKFKDDDCYSISVNYGIGDFNPVYLNSIPTLKTNSPPYALSFLFPIDTSLVKYEVMGQAYVQGNILYLKGMPGTICVKAIKSNRNNAITLTSTTCFDVTGEIITSMEEQHDPFRMVKLFPNPSTDGFYLQFQKEYNLKEDSLHLFDISGKNASFKLVKEEAGLYYLKPGNKPVSGVYLLKFELDGKNIIKKIMFE